MHLDTRATRSTSRVRPFVTFALSALLGIVVAGGGGAAGLALWWSRHSAPDGSSRAIRWALANGALLAIAGVAIGLVTALVAGVLTLRGHRRRRMAIMGLLLGGFVGGSLAATVGLEAGGVPVAVACMIAEPLVGLFAALWAAWRAA